ncbi:MAG: hypothetical protein Q7W13_12490 [Bacteroidia bacterium]|nr:hypothetical protein [Bacteroidia bacterium]
MDLKDFIKNTISSISTAITESQTELAEKGVIVNPERMEIGKNGEKLLRSDGWRYIQSLEFDILVGVEEQQNGNGKAELKVAGILNIGGGLTEQSTNQNQNRIKFNIPVAFPTSDTPEKYKSSKGQYSVA